MTPINEFFPLYPYDSENFLYTQYLTACFSHGGFLHLFLNMFVLYSFGQIIEKRFDKYSFLSFYLTLGVLANIMWHLIQDVNSPGLGSSGAIYGVVTIYTILYPNSQMSIIFLPFLSFKAVYLLGTIILVELVLTIMGVQDGIGHVVHLSGAVIGTIYYVLFLKTKKNKINKIAGVNKFGK